MFTIGSHSFNKPFVLAPLAGYTDLPFRLLCHELGADYTVSEMISCHGLVYNQNRTIEMLQSVPEERPVSFQLFGAEPDIMAEAARILNDFNPDMVDINMGCPVRKVTKKGAGAAMMSDPDLARQVIEAVVANSEAPVTVKFRAGVNNDERNAVSFGKMAEDAGAALVAVHGRTRAQAFSGAADRAIIREVKEALSIPVLGNGDILSYQDGLSMMEETGCDGVMIGRGALGNPWVFSPKGRPNSMSEVASGALRHLQFMEKFLPIEYMLGVIKNHTSKYFKDFPGSSRLRTAVFAAKDFTELYQMIEEIATADTSSLRSRFKEEDENTSSR